MRLLPTIQPLLVAPLMGAWIEIPAGWPMVRYRIVAPLMGAWIEIIFACDDS